MAKKIYKDGQYTGEEHLTEQEHQERQEAYAAADRGLRELLDHPYVNLFSAWTLFIIIAFGIPGSIITGTASEEEILPMILVCSVLLFILWRWIKSSRKRLKEMKEKKSG